VPGVILRTSSRIKRSKVKVTRPLWVAAQVTTRSGRGHIVSAALQAAQLVMKLAVKPRIVLLSGSSSRGAAASSFATSSLLIGFTGLQTDSYVTGSGIDRVTNTAASGWRQLLRRYVDSRFRSDAAGDKIFDVIAHNYDRWEGKSAADKFRQVNAAGEEVKGRAGVTGGNDDDDDAAAGRSGEIAEALLADSLIAAPTIRTANFHATCSQGQQARRRRPSQADTYLYYAYLYHTYLYYFNETGVTHDLLTYVFGAPMSPGIDPFHPGQYADTDRRLAADVIERWINFIHSGQVPNVKKYSSSLMFTFLTRLTLSRAHTSAKALVQQNYY